MPFYANRRWGHGRIRQLYRRFKCHVRGHRWGMPKEGISRCTHECGGMKKVR